MLNAKFKISYFSNFLDFTQQHFCFLSCFYRKPMRSI